MEIFLILKEGASMNYRINPKNGDKLSILGFGCMRFTKNGLSVDEKEVERQILYAIEKGVNYFDTAYIYPNSEEILGRILDKNNCREKVKIATKLPPYLVKKYSDFDKIFNAELERLKTNYIDYYFMHMLTDISTWNRLLDLGVEKWINEKKAEGKIRNVGFSYHGGKSEFIKLVDAYDWEFCMIQYNYVDENNQAGKSGLEYAASKDLPVMIMEPLRGGKLVTGLPKEVETSFKNSTPSRPPVEWALRWIWNHEEVAVVLSGMSSFDQVANNIEIASDSHPNSFTKSDLKLFETIKQIMNSYILVPCTACDYCMPCPVGVDIPTCFSCYNDIKLEGKMRALTTYFMQTSLKTSTTNASKCIKCGKCEKHCPQGIKIIEKLGEVQKNLEGFHYKPLKYITKKFMKL